MGASSVVPTRSGLQLKAVRLIASSALLAGLLTLAPAAQGHRFAQSHSFVEKHSVVEKHSAVSLSLNVTFFVNGTISVTLPDGTPVGSTSGAPTVIPAGFYTVQLSGPGGCTQVPYFELKGPGASIADNLTEGEKNLDSVNAYFMPNSTYTWRSTAAPAVVFTFITSADVQGTPPAHTGSSGLASDKHSAGSSGDDLVGSAIAPFRGTLTGAVSASGSLTLAFKGRSITSLRAGRYTVTVADKSTKNGVMLEKIKHPAVNVTGMAFVGKHSASVHLTAGKWFFTSRLLGKKTYFTVVK